jgi:DNA-binding response OmpR family regulator
MRLLIAEDEEEVAKLLKKTLEKEAYAVDYLTDGEAALRRLEISSKDYDLAILDLMLPRKSGLEICREIRAKNITLPILVLTTRDDVNDKVTALELGADDYLTKPFSMQELLARIRALLRRPVQSLPTELSIQDVTLNTSTRKVHRNHKEISLTVKEFSLLEYLMRHPNQVISRNQIIDHLWGYDFISGSNIVDVHIKNLRKKINNRKSKILETVRGMGYRVRADHQVDG